MDVNKAAAEGRRAGLGDQQSTCYQHVFRAASIYQNKVSWVGAQGLSMQWCVLYDCKSGLFLLS